MKYNNKITKNNLKKIFYKNFINIKYHIIIVNYLIMIKKKLLIYLIVKK